MMEAGENVNQCSASRHNGDTLSPDRVACKVYRLAGSELFLLTCLWCAFNLEAGVTQENCFQ